MLEKLLLAGILTFALTLLTEMSWPSSKQISGNLNFQNKEVLTLTQVDR